MEEIWKDIKGYEGLYQISNLGRVKSLARKKQGFKSHYFTKERILKNSKIGLYEGVRLYDGKTSKPVTIHRLLAIHFIPKVKGKNCVNHIDGNKLNNKLENLEWCTRAENNIHAWNNNLIKNANNKDKHKKVCRVDVFGNTKIYKSVSEASKENKISKGSISSVCLGIRNLKKAGGYHWYYIEEI